MSDCNRLISETAATQWKCLRSEKQFRSQKRRSYNPVQKQLFGQKQTEAELADRILHSSHKGSSWADTTSEDPKFPHGQQGAHQDANKRFRQADRPHFSRQPSCPPSCCAPFCCSPRPSKPQVAWCLTVAGRVSQAPERRRCCRLRTAQLVERPRAETQLGGHSQRSTVAEVPERRKCRRSCAGTAQLADRPRAEDQLCGHSNRSKRSKRSSGGRAETRAAGAKSGLDAADERARSIWWALARGQRSAPPPLVLASGGRHQRAGLPLSAELRRPGEPEQ